MYPSSLKFSFESYILIRAQEVPEIHQLADTQAAILQSCSRDSQYSEWSSINIQSLTFAS